MTAAPTEIAPESSDRTVIESPSAGAPEPPPGTVSGRVTETSERGTFGVASAQVRLTIARGDALRQVAELVTDSQGRYSVVIAELAACSPIERDTTRVIADAWADGFAQAQNSSYVTNAGNRLIDLDVELHRGRVVRGRVVRTNGQPVAYAEITGTGYGWMGPAGDLRSDIHGRFQRTVAFGVTAVFVQASAPNIGSGRVLVDTPGEATSIDAGDIELSEFGVLAGHVNASDDRPLPGLTLQIIRAREEATSHADSGVEDVYEDFVVIGDYASPSDLIARLHRPQDLHAMPGFDGFGTARAITDAHGGFRIAGLQPGSYWMQAEFGTWTDLDRPAKLVDANNQSVFETGSQSLALVASHCWIHARVTDAAGANVQGIELQFARLDRRAQDPRKHTEWNSDELASGEFLHSFQPGERVALRAKAGDCSTGERVVEVPQAGVVDVVLTLAPQAVPGRMRVKVTLPDGDECRDYTITLRSPASHLPIASYVWWDVDDDGWSPDLPGGTYDIEVQARERRPSVTPRLLPIHVDSVTLGPGSEPDLALAARLGGRLQIELNSTVNPDHRSITDDSGKLTVTDGAGRALELRTRIEWSRVRRTGEQLAPLGTIDVQPLLAPGTGRLRFELPGFEPIDVGIVIAAGETTELELDLIQTTTK